MKIGVLGAQGDVSEHIEMLERIGQRAIWVRKLHDLEAISGLIIPGGESTTITSVIAREGMFNRIKQMGASGFPIMGTCAGAILLAKKGDEQVRKTKQKLFELMDIEVCRNAFGRQRESFETELDFTGIGKIPAVFIRAPVIKKVWGNCKVLAEFGGKIVVAEQKNLIALAFHPELTDDTRVHEYFVKKIKL